MSENNWIEEAKIHFKENGNKFYNNGDEISKKSQEINEKLKNLLEEKLTNDTDVVLNKQGSKWNLQGHLKLKDYIWYRITYKEFGNSYPIVFGVALGKEGLNFGIQIYNDALGNLKISQKLSEIIKKEVENLKLNIKDIKRDNPKENYLDFGYVQLNEFDDNKFNEILDAYKKIIKKIYETLNLQFTTLIASYISYIKGNNLQNKYILVSEDNQFDVNKLFIKRKEINKNFKNFIDNPTKKNLETWCNHSINSANLVKNIEKKSKEEVEVMDDETRLITIQEEFIKIKDLIFNEKWEIKNNLILSDIEAGIKNVNSMNATAKELTYYLQMDEDKIPLVNSMTQRKVELIFKLIFPNLNKEFTLQKKFEELRNRICKKDDESFLEINGLKSFYLVDQFLNLIDKVKKDEFENLDYQNYKEMIEKALEFKDFLGGEVIQNDEFIELLKQGQNIIYYGSPGTGKTFGVLKDVKNSVDNNISRYEITQFHPSYSYEDFVEGIRPKGIDKTNGSMQFGLEDGEFKKFCKKALKDEDSFLELKEVDFKSAVEGFGYFFVIDEINRAELSRVFGELLFALEYRGKDKGLIKTQYSSLRDENESFYIPENLFLIGTMNDVDRSIDSFDLALRRRFIWVRKDCNYDVIENECKYLNKEQITTIFTNTREYSKACFNINEKIISNKKDGMGLGKKYEIGHAYFLKISKYTSGDKISQQAMNKLFDYHLEPLLSEYFRSEFNEDESEKHIKSIKESFKLESKQ